MIRQYYQSFLASATSVYMLAYDDFANSDFQTAPVYKACSSCETMYSSYSDYHKISSRKGFQLCNPSPMYDDLN